MLAPDSKRQYNSSQTLPKYRAAYTDRRPSPPEHTWTQEQNATHVFRIRYEGNRSARDGKLKVAPELIRPPFRLLVQLSQKEREI